MQSLGQQGVLLSCTISQELQVKYPLEAVRQAFTISIVSSFDYLWSFATFSMVNQLHQQLLSIQLWSQRI